jgi:hypothetical protein
MNAKCTSEGTTVADLLANIKEHVKRNPKNLEPVITELHAILNAYDPDIRANKIRGYRLVKDGFDADHVLKNIHELSKSSLTIPQIRFKADELSRTKQIPLPNSTRNHKEPLMQWFHIYWDELASEIEQWQDQTIPNAERN